MPGIKGQKWGIRRFQNEDGTLTEEGKRRYGETDSHTGDRKKNKKEKPESATWKSKDAKYLSDAELNRRNTRLQKEEQYRRMTQSKKAKAAKWIAATASTIFVAAAIEAAKNSMQNNYRDTFNKAIKKIKKTGKEKIAPIIRQKAASVATAAVLNRSIKRSDRR